MTESLLPYSCKKCGNPCQCKDLSARDELRRYFSQFRNCIERDILLGLDQRFVAAEKAARHGLEAMVTAAEERANGLATKLHKLRTKTTAQRVADVRVINAGAEAMLILNRKVEQLLLAAKDYLNCDWADDLREEPTQMALARTVAEIVGDDA